VPRGGDGELILELERQLATAREAKALEMNDDNTKLVKVLADVRPQFMALRFLIVQLLGLHLRNLSFVLFPISIFSFFFLRH